MSETSPAFHLPTSPLMRSLLDDTNLALSKFLEDQTVHSFLPVPGRRHRRYYRTSSSSFPGPYSVPPGVTSITLEKASEARKQSVSLLASQVSSMETMLSEVCEEPPGWTDGCQRVGVSGSICRTKFMPTSNDLFSLVREPWSSWLARAAWLSVILFFRGVIPSSLTSGLRCRRRKWHA